MSVDINYEPMNKCPFCESPLVNKKVNGEIVSRECPNGCYVVAYTNLETWDSVTDTYKLSYDQYW